MPTFCRGSSDRPIIKIKIFGFYDCSCYPTVFLQRSCPNKHTQILRSPFLWKTWIRTFKCFWLLNGTFDCDGSHIISLNASFRVSVVSFVTYSNTVFYDWHAKNTIAVQYFERHEMNFCYKQWHYNHTIQH